jgi:fibro-slime domain-containing protein
MPSVSRTKISSLVALAALCGAAAGAGPSAGSSGGATAGSGGANLPSTMVLSAVIRDFRPKEQANGHADFQAFTGTTTVGLVDSTLDADGKPVAISLRGQTINSEFKDAAGRNIMPAHYDPARGDVAGKLSPGGTGNGLASFEGFRQWFRDVPGVNVSKVVDLTFQRVPNTNRYVFDSAQHEPYKSAGGFFPINNDLFGNYGSWGKNFHFTTEIETEFTYSRGTGLVFKFTGDDDVWVFIGGRLVVDIGGLHPKREQFLDLDRLDWLNNGQTYTLKIFHAERRTTESNFRVETTLQLRPVELPPVAGLYD